MHTQDDRPTVVLICHEQDRLDTEGLASWLASTMRLAGLIIIRDPRSRLWRAARREIRRVGWLRFLDVVAFRAYRAAAPRRAATRRGRTPSSQRLRARYPADLAVGAAHRRVDRRTRTRRATFLERLRPDIAIARCKVILKRDDLRACPASGTFVLHPGICPEYRNAHGCFWALANRDLDRVGMTLLRVDPGIDTGPIFLHGTYDFDEVAESHSVIQYRAVIENLDAIGARAHVALPRRARRRRSTRRRPRIRGLGSAAADRVPAVEVERAPEAT